MPFAARSVSRDEARELCCSRSTRTSSSNTWSASKIRSPSIGTASGSTFARARTCHRTGFLKAVKLTSVAGAYWRGDERNPMLSAHLRHRVPVAQGLKRAPEAASRKRKKRDHRKLGKELKLFAFHPRSAGVAVLLAARTPHLQGLLESYVRSLYARYGLLAK